MPDREQQPQQRTNQCTQAQQTAAGNSSSPCHNNNSKYVFVCVRANRSIVQHQACINKETNGFGSPLLALHLFCQHQPPHRWEPTESARNCWDHLRQSHQLPWGTDFPIVNHFPFILAHEPINWFIPALPGNEILRSATILRKICCIFHMQQAVVQNSALPAESRLTAASPHCRENSSKHLPNLTFFSLHSQPVPLLSFDLTQSSSPCPQHIHFSLYPFVPFSWIYFTCCCCLVSSSITTHLHLFLFCRFFLSHWHVASIQEAFWIWNKFIHWPMLTCTFSR